MRPRVGYMPADQSTWSFIASYSREVFGEQDEHLTGLMDEAVAAGLPNIAIGPDAGRLLKLITSMTRGQLAVEVGTLAGYSGIWIARGLQPTGRLITIEYEPKHAEFASAQFERAGVSDQVEIEVGAGIEVLERLSSTMAPQSVDVLFLDAIKREYSDYFRIARPLVAVGGVVLADNVYGGGRGWISDGYGTDDFNRLVASDPDFETIAVPIGGGMLIARRSG